MKLFTNLHSGLRNTMALAILSISALNLSSCSSDPVAAPEVAYLSVLNASPTPATYNAYMGAEKVNSVPLPFGGGTNYFPKVPGSYAVKFTTASSTDAIINKNLNLENNKVYSLFLIDKGDKLDYLLNNDPVNNAASEKAFIRFANLSPDAPALSLTVKDSTTPLVTDKAYKTLSNFVETEAKSYILQVKTTSNGAQLKEDQTIELKAGKSYTLMAIGMLNATGNDQPFQIKIITNQ
jgi:hypothetical protein